MIDPPKQDVRHETWLALEPLSVPPNLSERELARRLDKVAALSSAISLKRIADALHGDNQQPGIARSLDFLEQSLRSRG